ncbi:ABC transporter permease [Tepidibacillus fermentans]|uniref:Putative ABC transport system permease protein n=1 Tax=Tepidibacillus fermentans TaxID=1281767 RepID=A0A4R3KID3_9BACI|nr:ABC transporter permease [Tepidibacillus fermentans]TCS82441.1 putative ABC transport system permease protein [Tepidibacillus fermentans]
MNVLIGSFEQGLIYSLMAIGVYLAFRILDYPDLTVDGSFPMGAALSTLLITKGLNPFFALFFALLAGGIAGFITGILHTKGKVNGLLAGILTMTALYSINLKIMGTANLSLFRFDTIFTPFENLKETIQQTLGDSLISQSINAWLFTIVLFIFVIVIKKLIDWFLQTELGLAIRATGDNPSMIRSVGVNTDYSTIIGLVLSNALVGLAGGIMAQYQGYADIQMGVGMIVVGLASVIIGEAIFGNRSIRRATFSVVCGAVIYRLVIALALYLPGFSPTDMKLITALLVIVSLTLPRFSLKNKKKAVVGNPIQSIDYSLKKVTKEG